MAASGAVALYHVESMTPEANDTHTEGLETIHVGEEELKETYEALNTGETPDIVIAGCPHASLREIIDIAQAIKGKTLKRELWVCTSRSTKEVAERMGLDNIIEEAGGHIVADTCMVVSPIEEMFKTTAVNSGKAATYLPGFCQQKVVFNNIRKLVEEA